VPSIHPCQAFSRFAGDVKALAAQNDVSSSIEMGKQEGDSRVQTLELDWLLRDQRQKTRAICLVRRQSTIKCRLSGGAANGESSTRTGRLLCATGVESDR